MSFLNSQRPDKIPGPIMGNPINGLCERTCVQVKKVFDACLRQLALEDEDLTLRNVNGAVQPFKFIRAYGTTSAAKVHNIEIEPLRDGEKCGSRVRCDVSVPITIIYSDADNATHTGTADLELHQDLIMYIPEDSIMPFEIEAVANVQVPEGRYVGADTFEVTCCVSLIMKVIIQVEMLVPTYGYCYIPPCHEFAEEACAGVFDLPLFPSNAPRR